jgi:hypothetical protein
MHMMYAIMSPQTSFPWKGESASILQLAKSRCGGNDAARLDAALHVFETWDKASLVRTSVTRESTALAMLSSTSNVGRRDLRRERRRRLGSAFPRSEMVSMVAGVAADLVESWLFRPTRVVALLTRKK